MKLKKINYGLVVGVALVLTACRTQTVVRSENQAATAESSTASANVRGDAPVSETPFEFIASGDWDGDSRLDVVVADKVTGRYRIAYQLEPGKLTWVSVRNASIPQVTGFTAGRLLDEKRDAFALTSPDAGTINIVDGSDRSQAKPMLEYAPATLGPVAIVAIDIGGDGNTSLADLLAGTIYNSPEPNRLDLLRNTGAEAEVINDLELEGELQRAERVELEVGVPLAAGFLKREDGKALRIVSMAAGEPELVVGLDGLGVNAEYLVARFGGAPMGSVLVYEPGNAEVKRYPAREGSDGRVELGEAGTLTFEEPVRQLFAVGPGASSKLLVVFGEGEKAGLFELGEGAAPRLIQELTPPMAEYWSGAATLGEDFVVLLRRPTVKYSSRCQVFKAEGSGYVESLPMDLTTLDENDLRIHALIVANLQVTDAASMKSYTNTIPGTKVNYAMVPVPGGEFVMGSPESEAGREADESPQHKVRVEPFWMGQYEVTWDEFELFMYTDEERKFRDTIKTDPAIDRISDAVSRPTRPYVEMSFGMGRYGYPAIAMTQHSANKYCQWLSAKTGHFYRLPTEAEWEYACRAGTTTAYYYGDDPAQIGQYGWFEDNGDFKYQKVGRKKPNPWGLYDMHGNVWEWCLDQYTEDYSMWKEPVVASPWNRATEPYPHVARGGSYDDMASRLRSAARRGSTRAWKMQDPQLPKSVWWLSDAPWVGFRLVRPLKVPSADELTKYWTSGVERD
jgi:formylglycine-generating enzyme required for sulfatase activity